MLDIRDHPCHLRHGRLYKDPVLCTGRPFGLLYQESCQRTGSAMVDMVCIYIEFGMS